MRAIAASPTQQSPSRFAGSSLSTLRFDRPHPACNRHRCGEGPNYSGCCRRPLAGVLTLIGRDLSDDLAPNPAIARLHIAAAKRTNSSSTDLLYRAMNSPGF